MSVKKKASASKKRTTAIARKKKSAGTPKKKTTVRAKKTAPKKKTVAKKKTTVAPKAKKKTVAPKAKAKKKSAALERRRVEEPVELAPSLPSERPLTDEEREAMAKCAQTALVALAADGVPEVIVASIARFVDEVRAGHRPEPDNQDVRLGLGVLWGEQVRAQVGWRWVHLSYPNGFASYALVPDDRAFACFPLNRLAELMRAGPDGLRVNSAVPLFDSIRVGTLPLRSENAYLVIG